MVLRIINLPLKVIGVLLERLGSLGGALAQAILIHLA
jgi:hypothetical protein